MFRNVSGLTTGVTPLHISVRQTVFQMQVSNISKTTLPAETSALMFVHTLKDSVTISLTLHNLIAMTFVRLENTEIS